MPSPSTSSSSSRSRTPLHDRFNSEKSRLGIRIVPYSPPRLEVKAGNSHGAGSGTGRDGAHHAANEPGRVSPTRRAGSISNEDDYAMGPASALPSPSTSTTSLVRIRSKGVSGTKPSSDSSGVGPSTPPPPVINAPSYGISASDVSASPSPSHQSSGRGSPASHSPTRKRPRASTGKFISINPDKTFSIVLKPTQKGGSEGTGTSQPTSSTAPATSNYSSFSSHERNSFDAPSDDRPTGPSSPSSSLLEGTVTPYTPASASSTASTEVAEDHTVDSPWNYRLQGGVRKVAKTPEPQQWKGKGKEVETLSTLPTLTKAPSVSPQPSTLTVKQSFQSESSGRTEFTIEQTTNYKVIGRSSPPDTDTESAPPSSCHSNYRILGESSPAHSFVPTSPARGVTDTPGSKNFVVHGGSSPSSSLPTFSRTPRPQYSEDSLVLRGKYSQESLALRGKYSQESLGLRGKYSQENFTVLRAQYSNDSLNLPPLRSRRKGSVEGFGYYKQRSRESLRGRGRANSFSSISEVLSQDADSSPLASSPNFVRLGSTPSTPSLPQSSWAESVPHRSRMEGHQHVWSSQLSTVMSEFEGSDRDSRALSLSSARDSRSVSGLSGYGSRHSRQMLSISSSLAAAEELSSPTDSIERPGPAFTRGGRDIASSPNRAVRDVDEHGDGLADLNFHELNHKSSRPRLSSRHLSSKSSSTSLRSTSSRTSLHSLSIASIPAWARLYYGSGERRWLTSQSSRDFSDDGRPDSSRGASASPSDDQFPVFSPRRRPREVHPADRPHSTEISPVGPSNIRRGVKKMTSSIWSPHLGLDRRATRYSIWQPPSVTWSTERGFGRRNIQIVLFAFGFVFPFAWMIAAFLPLPLKPRLETQVERDYSTTGLGIPEEPEPFERRVEPVDDLRYQSARWWRNLNRGMSVLGLLIIGAIVALVVIGLRQKWMQR